MANTVFSEPNRVKWVGVRPGIDGEQIVENAGQTGAGNAIIYTVPANKILLIFGGYTSISNSLVGATDSALEWWTVLVVTARLCYCRIDGVVSESVSQSFYPPIEIPAAATIRIYNGGAGNAHAGFNGILIDA